MKKNIFFTICLLFLSLSIHAQLLPELNYPDAKYRFSAWNARWITDEDAPKGDYAVVMFRCPFTLDAQPESFIIHMSADNRYKFYVNGKLAAIGPQLSNKSHWRYETLDIAPYLQAGNNILAAEVVNWGPDRFFGIMSTRTGFMLQGHTEKEWLVNSTNDGNWFTMQNTAYSPIFPNWMFGVDIVGGLYASNPSDRVEMSAYPNGWTSYAFDDSAWKHAKFIWNISGENGGGFYWDVMPRSTPQVEQTQARFKLARTEGITVSSRFVEGKEALTIPPNTKATILLDHETVTMGFPELILSGGKDANLRITYAENMFNDDLSRGDRNDIAGKHIRGLHDIIISDGRDGFVFSPTWYRAFRFIQFDIQTAGEALTLNDYYNMETKAPVPRRAVFDCDNADYKKIDEICWRTDAILTQSNLVSDAYYEQMMYVGDSRVHALVNLYMTGEDIWLRNAIEQFEFSRLPNGVLAGCYPTVMNAGWPGFTIVWVNILHDYMMHCGDKEFIKRYARGIKASFNWFEDNIDDNGMIKGRGFIDWYSEPDLASVFNKSRNSAAYTLLYAEALQNAAELYEYIDMPIEAIGLRQRAEAAKAAVMATCWNKERQLLTEDSEGNFLDERPNILATVAKVGDTEFQRELFSRTIDAKDISQSTYYFRFYYMLAMRSLGLGNRMDDVLDIWKDLLPLNMTTVPERIAFQRSEAHAWSAAPCIGFVRVAAGIAPAEPGYKSVEIAPELGKLNFIKASYPHYLGDIKVDLKRTKKGGLEGTVELPAGLTGTFKYNGTTLDLTEGVRVIKM